MTIRTRLALWYSGLLMIVIIIFSIAVITVSRVTLLQAVDQLLDGVISTVESNIDPVPVDEFEMNGAVEIFYRSDEIFHAPGFSVQIWRTHEQGEALASPVLDRASNDIAAMESPLDPNYMHSPHTVFNSIMVSAIPERVITQPFTTRDGLPLGVIQVASPLSAVANANDQLLIITLITATICILVSIWLGQWVSAHLLKPIEMIKQAAANVANADDLSNRIRWDGPDDELGQLTRSFNHMMGRLEKFFKLQQEFIGDVSHELRTPLTSIIGHLDIMDRYGVDKESLDALHREATRMSRMVADLLLLTRADAGTSPIDLYPVDLDAIMLEVFEQSVSLVKAKKKTLSVDLARVEPVRINGNSDRLRQLLLNLLHNAIKFTDDGGTISFSCYANEDSAVIEIKDTGIGIEEDDLPRVFDRFFRADSARVYRDDSDGAGLGLSIAKWIVDAHQGVISIDSTVGKGTTFKINFPALKATHAVV